MNKIAHAIRAFALEEEGSEVVEYALIIALVSIVLAVALASGGLDDAFTDLVTRVKACFAPNATSC